jgi:hypothetical protein
MERLLAIHTELNTYAVFSVCSSSPLLSVLLIPAVSLPELVAQTNMDQQSVNRLREELTKLTNWLSRNTTVYFISEYEIPGAQYIEKARSQ